MTTRRFPVQIDRFSGGDGGGGGKTKSYATNYDWPPAESEAETTVPATACDEDGELFDDEETEVWMAEFE